MTTALLTPTQAERPHVVIVGAGPSGCLTALLLAKHGARVTLYDYRSDPRSPPSASATTTPSVASARSINLALSTRGLTALRRLNIDAAVTKRAIPMPARCIHPKSSSPSSDHPPHALHPYGQPHEHLLSVSRSTLTAVLLDACDRHDAVTIAFHHKCISVDFRTPTVTVQPHTAAPSTPVPIVVPCNLVVGADGTFSCVRAAMARMPRFHYSQNSHPCAYKELSLSVSRRHFPSFPVNALHIWPRGHFMLIALPNHPDDVSSRNDTSDDILPFTATLFMPHEMFVTLNTPQKIRAFFETNFRDVLPHMPSLIDDFEQNPIPHLVTIRCAPFHAAGTGVLVGDAAHAIVPFYGQGCNASLEDCTYLSDSIATHGWHNLQPALEAYTNGRKPNVDAIAHLAEDHYIDMAVRSASPIAVGKRRLAVCLNRYFPAVFRPLYSMVSFSNIPYAQAVARARKQDIAVGVGVAVASTTMLTVLLGGVVVAARRYRAA